MPPAAVIGGIAGSALGGISGAMGTRLSQNSLYGVNVAPASALELQGQQGLSDAYSQLQGMVGAGPGQSDVAAGYGAQKDLAAAFQQYAQGGYLPNAQQTSTANAFAASQFAPQQVALQQSFLQQTQQANQAAAAMGASANDPILQAKLRIAQTQQQNVLNAQQGAFGMQTAMNMPMQQLAFQQAYAQTRAGLATQALANRQALASMGDAIMQQQQNWRLMTAQKYGQINQQSGGGLGGGIAGAMGGLGAGLSAGAAFGSLGGGKGTTTNLWQNNAPQGQTIGPPNPFASGNTTQNWR